MNVTIINRSDCLGGAAVVSRRLMNALRAEGVNARMLVVHAATGDENVTLVSTPILKVKFLAERAKIFLNNGFDRSKLFLVDDASFGIDFVEHPLITDTDVIVLGWINQAMMGYKQLERLAKSGKPIVWVMHDLWNCTAVCHHPQGCSRFTGECRECPQTNGRGNRMVKRATEGKKQLYADADISFVAVSNWVKAACEKSTLLAGKKVTVIPNAFNLESIDYSFRQFDGLQGDKVCIAMGAARLDVPIKGFDTLIALSRLIAREKPLLAARLHLLLFGDIRQKALLNELELPYTWLGYSDDPSQIYRSAKIVLSTSRYETFGATLVEGIAAGCFAVSTSAGGQSDIIEHKVNGYLADNVFQLAQGIEWAVNSGALTRRELHESMQRFDSRNVARRFISLFNNLQKHEVMKKIIIAIDGFSSTGKSTMAKTLAKAVGYAYFDTGAMYRAVTLYCLQNGIISEDGEIDKPRLIEQLPNIKISFVVGDDGKSLTCLNGEVVEQEIRSMRVSGLVSIVATIAEVRHAMVRQQQEMGKDKGLVMDGRDIGTVVFPEAEMKVFVTASDTIRAQRRFDELKAKGDTTTTFDEVLENVKQRDLLDTTRKESPLRQADDAILLDNSEMTPEQQDRWLLDKFHEIVNS